MAESRFDFCPRCGAVARDGKCQSCGYLNEKIQQEMAKAAAQNTEGLSQETQSADCKTGKKAKGAAVPVIIIIIVLFLVISSNLLKMASEVITDDYEADYDLLNTLAKEGAGTEAGTEASVTVFPEPGSLLELIWDNPLFFTYDDGEIMGEDGYDYADRGTDCYYFDDYFSTDVDYSVRKKTLGYSNSDNWLAEYGYDFATDFYMYSEFYSLENTGLANEEEINSFLYEIATYAPVIYDKDKKYINATDGYYVETYETVTYMDADTISVLVEMYGYVVTDMDTDAEDYEQTSTTLFSAVIDLKTGSTIEALDLFEIDRDFVVNFFTEVNRQNDIDLYDSFSVEELLTEFENGNLLFVYTPLGVEFGFAYPDYSGYITCTCTDYQKYLKKD